MPFPTVRRMLCGDEPDGRLCAIRVLGWARSAVFLFSMGLVLWLAFWAPVGSEEARIRLASAVAGVGVGWSLTMQFCVWRYP